MLNWLFKGCNQGVHRFKPRYNERYPEWFARAREVEGNWRMEKTYVCDVCVRCGKTTLNGAHPLQKTLRDMKNEAA